MFIKQTYIETDIKIIDLECDDNNTFTIDDFIESIHPYINDNPDYQFMI